MWLCEQLKQICFKEFTLRHLLDILQDDAYINHNLQKLISLNIGSEANTIESWQQVAARCDSYWSNIVGYVKTFQKVFDILVRTNFFSFEPVELHAKNLSSVLQERIRFCREFIEISRTITYHSSLKIHFARIERCNGLFHLLNLQCTLSDPPGNKLIPLGNRVRFIRQWIEKLVIQNQHSLDLSLQEYSSDYPKIVRENPVLPAAKSLETEILTPKHKAIATRTVSVTKSNLRFYKIKRKPKRLSDILNSQDSDTSSSSTDSLWNSPFPTKRNKL